MPSGVACMPSFRPRCSLDEVPSMTDDTRKPAEGDAVVSPTEGLDDEGLDVPVNDAVPEEPDEEDDGQ